MNKITAAITGVEGYVESAAIGLLAGRFAAAERFGEDMVLPPATTAHGALLSHVTDGADDETFQPMNVNFGLFPPLKEGAMGNIRRKEQKAMRRRLVSRRALSDIAVWLSNTPLVAE